MAVEGSGIESPEPAAVHLHGAAAPTDASPAGASQAVAKERRGEPRYPVEARGVLLLVKSATGMPGRLLDLSLHGCQIQTQERFTLGIFARVEIEFLLRGMTFRLSGVTQSIHDVYSIGVRFLAVSERCRGQLIELIAELGEAPGPDRRT